AARAAPRPPGTDIRPPHKRRGKAAPATPPQALLSPAFRLAQLDQLGVLEVAVHAADRDMQQARQPVEEAEAQHVELDEAHQRREREVPQAGALALLERLARGQRRVAV